ncbi:MAG: hypothetical protein Q9169_000659 [Polycauliona sp. 2 TL-2023]
MNESRWCGFLDLPPELRIQVFRDLLEPGRHRPLRPPQDATDHRPNFKKSQEAQPSPVTCSFSMDPVIFAVNHQLKFEARSVLDECNVWEIRTADLLEDVDRDVHGEVVSELCSITMDLLERHLQCSPIHRWHLVIDTTFYGYDEQDGSLLASELTLLAALLQRLAKLLTVAARSPEVTLSWHDDGFVDWEDRRKLLFGRLLAGFPASPCYKLGTLPNSAGLKTSLAGTKRNLISRELFAQSMTADLGIVMHQ